MKKHAIISLVLIIVLIVIPMIVHAATFVQPSASFGGRIISTYMPSVACIGLGTGPLIISNVTSGIPYYAITNFSSSLNMPTIGGWILGRVNIAPETYRCYLPYLEGVPFPVRDTSLYGVSH